MFTMRYTRFYLWNDSDSVVYCYECLHGARCTRALHRAATLAVRAGGAVRLTAQTIYL